MKKCYICKNEFKKKEIQQKITEKGIVLNICIHCIKSNNIPIRVNYYPEKVISYASRLQEKAMKKIIKKAEKVKDQIKIK